MRNGSSKTKTRALSFLIAAPIAVAFLFLGNGCVITEEKIDQATMLDGNLIFDSLSYLVSDSFPNPTDSMKNMPVLIAAHGFTATTYEWQDFSKYRDSVGGFLLSRVLLGGHGRSYEVFKNSTWQDWQAPILKEYEKLTALGYKNISLAGSSTGGALIIELMARGKLDINPPRNLFMIDAIVVPGSKILSMIDILGPALGNSISGTSPEEAAHWYTNRPQEALNELMDVISLVRNDLEDIVQMPPKTDLVIYKTKGDQTADPISGLLMYKGTKASAGGSRTLKMLDSKRHVFTRGTGRDNWTDADKKLQFRAFDEIRLKLLGLPIVNPL